LDDFKLRKVSMWSPDSTDELERMLMSNSVEVIGAFKEGLKTLELKK